MSATLDLDSMADEALSAGTGDYKVNFLVVHEDTWNGGYSQAYAGFSDVMDVVRRDPEHLVSVLDLNGPVPVDVTQSMRDLILDLGTVRTP